MPEGAFIGDRLWTDGARPPAAVPFGSLRTNIILGALGSFRKMPEWNRRRIEKSLYVWWDGIREKKN